MLEEAGNRPGCFFPNLLSKVCQKEPCGPRRARSQVLLTGGLALEPGLEAPPGGCPGHSPLNPEALNMGGVVCHWQQAASEGWRRDVRSERAGRLQQSPVTGHRANLAGDRSLPLPSGQAAQHAVAPTQVERSQLHHFNAMTPKT